MYDGSVRINAEIDTKSFDQEINQMLDKIEDLENQLSVFEPNTKEYQDVNVELEKTRNKLSDLIAKQNKLNEAKGKVDFSEWIKQLTKVGFAMFGIRGAMGVLRKASSTYLSQNEETAKKMQSIWIALGNAIGPVIEMIANGILKIVGYLNVFVKALTGGKVDLTKGMNNNSKAINGTTKAMKDLNKQMASFDEMNVLSNNTNTSGTGVSGSEFQMPELDENIAGKLENIAKWLKENWEWFGLVAGAVGLLIGSKVLGTGLLGLGGILSGLMQIGVIAIGVDLLYKGLTGRDLVKDITEIIDSLKILNDNKKEYSKMDDEVHDKTIQALDDRKKEIKSYEKGSTTVAQLTGNLRNVIEMNKKEMESGKLSTEEWKKRKKEIDKSIEVYKELYEQGKLTERQTKTYRDLMGQLGLNVDGTRMSFKNFTDYIKFHYDKEVQDANEETGIFGTALTNLVKKDYTINVNTNFNKPDTSKLEEAINKINKNYGGALGIAFGGTFKMASGGIVNNPGKGVALGNNIIAGESGREWIQPLDDPASLQLIGETIGRYITVNANVVNTMNGRVISRELQRVQNDNDFAYNR